MNHDGSLDRPTLPELCYNTRCMRVRTSCLGKSPLRGVLSLLVGLGIVATPLAIRAEVGGSVASEPEPPARPPPLADLEAEPLPITRHIDIGAAAVLVERVAEGQTEFGPSVVRYSPSVGFGMTARIDIMRYLRGNLYALRSTTDVDLPAAALGLPGDPGLMPVTNYSFGVRFSPTLPLGTRARTWLTVGVGWGRVELGRFDVASPAGSFQVRERAFSFVEVPMGLGTSFDIIPNWLSIEFETTAALHGAQRGTALRTGQTIDATGRRHIVEPFPALAVSFVQTLGLALVL